MSTSVDEPFDPFEAHFQRDPLPGAAVRVVVLVTDGEERAAEAARSIVGGLRGFGRSSDVVIIDPADGGRGRAVEDGIADTQAPLVLVTDSPRPWTADHLKPLLQAIDRSDHVIGCRRSGLLARIGRWIAGAAWRWVFAVPVADIHSPCRLHRLDKLSALPMQSCSSFLDVEVLAKATFLGHLIDEVMVPDLETPRPRVAWSDVRAVFRRPTFVRRSGPAEDAQGDREGDDGPGEHDRQGGDDDPVEPAGPFQDHGA